MTSSLSRTTFTLFFSFVSIQSMTASSTRPISSTFLIHVGALWIHAQTIHITRTATARARVQEDDSLAFRTDSVHSGGGLVERPAWREWTCLPEGGRRLFILVQRAF